MGVLQTFIAKLDAVCGDLGVAPLSSFFDTSGDEADLDELDLLIDNGAHLATQGTWFAPADVLVTLHSLRDELHHSPRRFGLLSNKYADVMDALEQSILTMEGIQATGGQTHFWVV